VINDTLPSVESSLFMNLGQLADPNAFQEPLDIQGEDPAWLMASLRRMVLIRRAEEVIAEMVASSQVRCPCHLAIGQEAMAVGVARWAQPSDRVFGAHRSHAHFLALGGSVFELLAEVLGRQAGCSRGMGGSMHLISPRNALLGTVPIVAATIPIAVGAALAARLDGSDSVAVSFFGDGATEEGAFHESMNLAATRRLPIVFVCENNLFSSHLHISLRQPKNILARYAAAHCIPSCTIDGNDVIAVSQASAAAFERARRGEGPAFIEGVTYRWRGHVGHREDNDVGVQRESTLASWKKRDPIRRLADALTSAGLLSTGKLLEINEEMADEVTKALSLAEKAPFPPAEAVLELVYSKGGV
jgi:TPP-dependent pyruvate/acetoin dehydrogenase alpha subunit